MFSRQRGAVSRVTLITIVSIAILILLAILFLPRGFSNDISKIGNGSKIAVFAYNNGTTNSMSMMDLLNQVRSSYSDKIDFLAVSISAPIGKKFLKDHNTRHSTLILFNENGSQFTSLEATEDENLLRQTLENFINSKAVN